MIGRWTAAGEAKSVGLLGNAADVFPELVRARRARPTSSPTRPRPTIRSTATCRRAGPWPSGGRKRETDPKAVERAARASMKTHVAAMVDFWNAGVPTLDYGNNIRQMALEEGLADAFAFPGFVPAYIRPLFCRGIGPFRWCALSGDPEDIYATDAKVKELIPDDAHLHRWLDMARERIAFQGLPARICWVGLGRAAPARARVQRDGALGRAEGADGDRPRPPRLRARSRARTARPRRWRTGRTPSPTGRCSTRC